MKTTQATRFTIPAAVLAACMALSPISASAQAPQNSTPLITQESHAKVNEAIVQFRAGNFKKAYELSIVEGHNGNPTAQNVIGTLYATGKGVKPNREKAAQWFLKASEQGSRSAQYKLGVMYSLGDGVSINAKKAKYWLQLSAEAGHKQAGDRLKFMEIKEIEDRSFANEEIDKQYADNCTRYLRELKLGDETTRCKKRGLAFIDQKIKANEEALKNARAKQKATEQKLQAKQKEKASLLRVKKKYSVIKSIEDRYVRENLLGNRYRENCARYFDEARLGGERMRCLERAIRILENRR